MNIYDDDYSPENEKEEDKELIEELKKFKNLEEEEDEQGVFGSNEDEDALFEMISASVSKQHGAGPKSDGMDDEDDLLDYRESQMANTYNPDDDHTRILFDDRGLPVFDENGELIYVDEDYYVNHSLFKEIDFPSYDAVETLSEENDYGEIEKVVEEDILNISTSQNEVGDKKEDDDIHNSTVDDLDITKEFGEKIVITNADDNVNTDENHETKEEDEKRDSQYQEVYEKDLGTTQNLLNDLSKVMELTQAEPKVIEGEPKETQGVFSDETGPIFLNGMEEIRNDVPLSEVAAEKGFDVAKLEKDIKNGLGKTIDLDGSDDEEDEDKDVADEPENEDEIEEDTPEVVNESDDSDEPEGEEESKDTAENKDDADENSEDKIEEDEEDSDDDSDEDSDEEYGEESDADDSEDTEDDNLDEDSEDSDDDEDDDIEELLKEIDNKESQNQEEKDDRPEIFKEVEKKLSEKPVKRGFFRRVILGEGDPDLSTKGYEADPESFPEDTKTAYPGGVKPKTELEKMEELIERLDAEEEAGEIDLSLTSDNKDKTKKIKVSEKQDSKLNEKLDKKTNDKNSKNVNKKENKKENTKEIEAGKDLAAETVYDTVDDDYIVDKELESMLAKDIMSIFEEED